MVIVIVVIITVIIFIIIFRAYFEYFKNITIIIINYLLHDICCKLYTSTHPKAA